MIKPILLTCVALLAAGTALTTDYSADKGFKVEFESTLAMKTTSSSMERDGEPVEGRGNMGDMASSQSRKAVYTDKIVAAKDGKPTKLTRAFETLAGVDTWIVDALRHTPHPTHAHLERTLDWIARVKPRRAILTNMHIDMDYNALKAQLPDGVEPGWDGMTVEIGL